MSDPLTYSQMSANWKAATGLMLVAVAVKMAVSGVAHSPLVAKPKRPTLVTSVIVGSLLKDAFIKLGRGI